MELISILFREGQGRKVAHDDALFEFVLRRYEFGMVLKQEFGRSLMPELCLAQPTRARDSLYVEAKK